MIGNTMARILVLWKNLDYLKWLKSMLRNNRSEEDRLTWISGNTDLHKPGYAPTVTDISEKIYTNYRARNDPTKFKRRFTNSNLGNMKKHQCSYHHVISGMTDI